MAETDEKHDRRSQERRTGIPAHDPPALYYDTDFAIMEAGATVA